MIFGCVGALVLHRRSTYDVAAHLGRYPLVTALGALLVALQFLIPNTGTGEDLYAPYGAVACLLLIGLVTTTAPWIAWLWSRPMVVTATLSYALHLIHNFGLNFAQKIVPAAPGLAGSRVDSAGNLACVSLRLRLERHAREALHLAGASHHATASPRARSHIDGAARRASPLMRPPRPCVRLSS